MALTKTYNRMIEDAVINVKDYGAIGDNTAADLNISDLAASDEIIGTITFDT